MRTPRPHEMQKYPQTYQMWDPPKIPLQIPSRIPRKYENRILGHLSCIFRVFVSISRHRGNPDVGLVFLANFVVYGVFCSVAGSWVVKDIRGKRSLSSVFWILQVPEKGERGRKRAKKGRLRPISRKRGQTPLRLKPHLLHPHLRQTKSVTNVGEKRMKSEGTFLPPRNVVGKRCRREWYAASKFNQGKVAISLGWYRIQKPPQTRKKI